MFEAEMDWKSTTNPDVEARRDVPYSRLATLGRSDYFEVSIISFCTPYSEYMFLVRN